jgi:transcriptional regulator with XRE-family HTH domain
MKNKVLARRIKELRNKNGFSQEELAEKTGLSLRTIQRIENGETEPRGDSLKKIATTFRVSLDEITDSNIVEDKNILVLLNLSCKQCWNFDTKFPNYMDYSIVFTLYKYFFKVFYSF